MFLGMQIDLKHKPTVHSTAQHRLSPADFTPASSQPFCTMMLGKSKAVFCKVVWKIFFCCFIFQLIAFSAATVGLWKMLWKKIAIMIESH